MNQSYTLENVSIVAAELLARISKVENGATIVALAGDLGAGKTTLVQSIAKSLGITETVVSPTFVVAKWYEILNGDFDTLVHIDAYRIESEEELVPLGIEALLQIPRTLVIVEWPEKISSVLTSAGAQLFSLVHGGDVRHIEGPTPFHHA